MHLHHCPQKSMTEPYFEALLKEVTKTKTMGAPKKAAVRKVAHKVPAAHSDNGSFASAEQQLRKKAGGKHGAVIIDVDTLASKIPIKWAVSGAGTSTAYTVRLPPTFLLLSLRLCAQQWQRGEATCVQDTIGATAQASIKAAKSRATAFEPIVITCPIGSCDAVTDISRFPRFAVPEGYVQETVPLFTDEERNPPETTARMTFQRRRAQDIAQSMAAAAEQVKESQKMKVCLCCLVPLPCPRSHDGLAATKSQRGAEQVHDPTRPRRLQPAA